MLNTLRRFWASCDLDRAGGGARSAGEFEQVHRLLSQPDAAPRQEPSRELRSRIMDGLRAPSAPADRVHGWRWALAAAACLTLGVVAIPFMRHAVSRAPGADRSIGLSIPMGATPMFRLVAGSVDQPLLDQAQKMYTDTRRATRAVANCVPFARGG